MARIFSILVLLSAACTPALSGIFPGAVYPGTPAVASDRPAVHRWVLRDRDGVAIDIDVVPRAPIDVPSWERGKRLPRAWKLFVIDAQWSDDRRFMYSTETGALSRGGSADVVGYGDPACTTTPLAHIDPGRMEGCLDGTPVMQSGEPWTAPVYEMRKGVCEPTTISEGAPLTPLVPVPPELANRFNKPPYTITWE